MRQFSIVTFGCQMNEHDSSRMAEILRSAGYVEAESVLTASVVILNTCSIREKAEQKLRSEVGRLAMRKREQLDLVIVVAGCVGQQESARLLKSAPDIDLVIGPDNIPSLPALIADVDHGGPRRAVTVFDMDAPRFLAASLQYGRAVPSTYVTVMKGCDERCSYCIVPYTRGSERYRASRDIIEEVRGLVAAGVREITLLGQTVNSYRDPDHALGKAPETGRHDWTHTTKVVAEEDESEFPALLYAIAESVPGLLRLRYTSPHPRHLTRALIEAHRCIPILAKHLHLPVQSGNNGVLKRMIRRYTREEYIERVTALKQAVPGLSLSTDIIVGFPGETEDQFNDTVTLVEELKFTGVFGFKYSPRPGTPSLKLSDELTEEEKSQRLDRLFSCHDKFRRSHLASLVGSTQEVLCEGRKKDGAYTGRTVRNEIVHFGSRSDVTGQIVPVRIVLGFKNSLGGELLDENIRIFVGDLPKLAGHFDDDGQNDSFSLTASPDLPEKTDPKRQLRVI